MEISVEPCVHRRADVAEGGVDQQMIRDGRNRSARWPFRGAMRNAVSVVRPFKGAMCSVTVAALGISLIACGGSGDAERDAATAAATAAATGSGPADLPAPSDDWKPKIPTASLPENPCRSEER